MWTPGQLRSSWRLPGRDPVAFVDVAHFRRLAQIAEAAKIDAVLLGDAPALGPGIDQFPPQGIDPPILMAHLAAVTERLGLVATSSATYNDPYNLARRYLGLDHVSGGRAAINVVTTYTPEASANFGLAEPPDKADRYRRAAELLEVLIKLWDAWDEDAIIGDQRSGRWADPTRIHPIDHVGDFFSVRGPLSVPTSPQGRPLIFQAGGSEGGLALTGRFADAVFTVGQTQAKAIAFRDEIRRRTAAAGRDPDSVKVSLGVVVITDATEAAARDRARALQETIDVPRATVGVVRGLGLDPERFGPDDLIRASDLPPDLVGGAPEGFQVSTRALLAQRPQTPRQLIYGSAGGNGHRLVVGSAEQIADDLEDWFRAGAADGFTVMRRRHRGRLRELRLLRGADPPGTRRLPPGLCRADAARELRPAMAAASPPADRRRGAAGPGANCTST